MKILFGTLMVLSFIGMIGENGKKAQKHYTVAFVASLVAAVIATVV